MRCISKRLISFVMVLLITVSCFGISVIAVDSDAPDDNGQMNLDVVFVIDSSGSMAEADPNRVAVDAFRLFIDLCDDSCSVGYTVYSEKIKEAENITHLDQQHLSSLKEKINQINTNPYGDTDIALGLTKAMELHQANKNTDEKRKKTIILLSDGNTHLIEGPRTVEESKKELEATLKALNESGIPVYSIGLNYDGTLDKKESENIAAKTNGKAYETKSSDELPAIIADIFADVYQIKGAQKEIVDGNVEIYIKDKSVFYVNIVIRSRLTVEQLNPVLLTPRRQPVDLSGKDENIKMTSTGSYTLIKLIYPESGRWKLHLDNATSQNCIVTQLDFYSVYVKQSLDNSLVLGQNARIEASLNQSNGIVSDSDLIDTITMTSTITGNGETKQVKLTLQNNSVFVGEYFADQEGTYTIITTAESEKFHKNSAPITFTVRHYTEEELKRIKNDNANLNVDVPNNDQSSGNFMTTVIIGAIVLLVIIAAVIILLKVKERNDQSALSMMKALPEDPPLPERPKPVAPPIEKVKEGPKATDPDYVNIPLVEHGSLESLIKKGPDDAFNANADAYKADASLEALIRKGPDNDLGVGKSEAQEEADFDNTHDEGYQTGRSLSDMFGAFDDGSSGGVDLNKRN